MTPAVRPLPDPQPLDDALAAGCDPGQLRPALGQFEQALRGHARAVDRGGGLLGDGDRTRPALERREGHLLGELGGLLERTGELLRRLERGESSDGWCEDVRGLAAAVRRLRDGEAGLAQEAALSGDLGAGD